MADLATELARRYAEWHGKAIRCLVGVDEQAAAWRPERGPQSLLWQLWHVARWDDRLGVTIASCAQGLRNQVPKVEIWVRDSIAKRWGWPADLDLGSGNAGTGLSFEGNAALRFPGLDGVVDYARHAFSYAELAVGALDPNCMDEIHVGATGTGTWATNLFIYLEHLPEHIAVMEVLRALQGLPEIGDG